jgi:ComF family protein
MRGAGASWISFCNEVLNWVYPSKCALCSLLADSSPCAVCASEMALASPNFVIEDEGGLDFRACRFSYDGRAAQAVRRLKYGRSTSLVAFTGGAVRERLEELGVTDELVTPVPMSPARKSWRGFNQAELLVSGCSHLDVQAGALARVRNTRPQVGLTLKERQENLRGAFRAHPSVAGRSVILVDDVVTSGQTGRECARALREAGATSVGIVAFAGNLI